MSLLIAVQHRDMTKFKDEILHIDKNIDVEIWPNVKHPDRVQFAVAWDHPKQIFQNYPNLKAVSSLGAGVDHLLSDNSIPETVHITRVVAPSLTDQMSDFVLTAVLNLFRNTERYVKQQQKGHWEKHKAYSKSELTIGIMGLGELGKAAAQRLIANGFNVKGWARTQKSIAGLATYSNNELTEFLNGANVLVCLLPLTSETDGILEIDLFKKLSQPAFLINAARGEHLVEEDLIYALDTGLINHAVLDVFPKEPLPESHAFWNRDKITITPHIASVTDPKEAATLIVENYKRLLSGMELLNAIDKKKGY